MNIGLIYFKREENDFKFLLGSNLKILNLDNKLYSDLGGNFEEDNLVEII